MVLGSNRRKHWVSGRAVYALRTNGNCSVIMRRGGGVGRYDAASHQTRQAGRVGGSCDSGRIFLAEHPLLPPLQGLLSEKADRGGDRGDVVHT